MLFFLLCISSLEKAPLISEWPVATCWCPQRCTYPEKVLRRLTEGVQEVLPVYIPTNSKTNHGEAR